MAQDFGIFRPVQKGGFVPEEQMTQLTFWKPWFEDGGWYFLGGCAVFLFVVVSQWWI